MKIRHIGATALAAFLLWGLAAHSARAGDEMRESVRVTPGGQLSLEIDGGAVEVETHHETEVDVYARADGGSGSMRFELSSDGVDARLTGRRSGWLGGLLGGSVRVRVRVPEEFSIDLHTGGGRVEIEGVRGRVSAHTSGGDIELEGAVGGARLVTSGGDVGAEKVEGDVYIRTSGGDIQAEEIAGSVDAETSGGNVSVVDVTGPVDVHTSGGRIELRFSGRAEGRAETSGGSIKAEIPSGVGIDLEAHTSGGRIRLDDEFAADGHVSRDDVKARLNGGGPRLSLRTSGGNVTVRMR